MTNITTEDTPQLLNLPFDLWHWMEQMINILPKPIITSLNVQLPTQQSTTTQQRSNNAGKDNIRYWSVASFMFYRTSCGWKYHHEFILYGEPC
jgi:hypothetical protein